jgi:hypothetical protein
MRHARTSFPVESDAEVQALLLHITVNNLHKLVVQLLDLKFADCRLQMVATDAAVIGEEQIRAARRYSHKAQQIFRIFISAPE